MSDRFYMQMVQTTGWAPGYKNTSTIEEYKSRFGSTKRRKTMSWTDEKKQEVIDMYVGEEPTPENGSKTTSFSLVKAKTHLSTNSIGN